MLFLYNLYIAYLLLQIPYRNLTIDYYYIVTVFYMSHIFDHWLPLELLFHIFLMHMMSLQCRHADVYAGARRAADGPPSCIETVAPIRYHPSSDRADRLARDLARGGCRSTAVAYAKARARTCLMYVCARCTGIGMQATCTCAYMCICMRTRMCMHMASHLSSGMEQPRLSVRCEIG